MRVTDILFCGLITLSASPAQDFTKVASITLYLSSDRETSKVDMSYTRAVFASDCAAATALVMAAADFCPMAGSAMPTEPPEPNCIDTSRIKQRF